MLVTVHDQPRRTDCLRQHPNQILTVRHLSVVVRCYVLVPINMVMEEQNIDLFVSRPFKMRPQRLEGPITYPSVQVLLALFFESICADAMERRPIQYKSPAVPFFMYHIISRPEKIAVRLRKAGEDRIQQLEHALWIKIRLGAP